MEKQVDVAIIMGSDSDLEIMKDAAKFLDDMGISYEMTILSVHRCPEEAHNYAKSLKERKVKVIIAGAGGAAHLPGVFAALVPCPVIGVPIMSKTLNGLDSLYSIVQMPSGIPVVTILSTSNDELYKKLCDYKDSLNKNVLAKNDKLQKIGYEQYLKEMK